MELVLTADPTRPTGTRPSRRMRRDGQIPAVVYGLGSDAVAVSVDWRELRQCLKTEAGINAVIHLDIEGDRHLSIVKEIQRHPVRRDVIHVDFLRVDPTAEVSVEVPVTLVGEAKKVAAMQGIVDQQMFHMTVSSRPDAIPNDIVIDVADLDIGDVPLPAGVTALSDAEATVVQGSATRSTIMLRKGVSPEDIEAAAEAELTGEATEAEAPEGEAPEAAAAEASEDAADAEGGDAAEGGE